MWSVSKSPGRFLPVLAAVLLIFAPATPVAAGAAPASFADLVSRLLPAVVNISAVETGTARGAASPSAKAPQGSPFHEFYRHFFGSKKGAGRLWQAEPETAPEKATALGSGFIIDPEGYVVTNNHVVAKADRITVILQDGTNLTARLVGRDKKTDIALLKVDAGRALSYLRWGNSDKARVGDWVLAIGNPFGLGGTVTAGILSARQRDISSGPYDDFLQTDAAINRGNSGGPMLDMNGRVIGVNTAIYSPSGGSIGIGFAIPSAVAKTIVSELMQEPDHAAHRGWLGLSVQEVTPAIARALKLAKAEGALVAGVSEKGPAALAGIKPGDVILAFNGKPVTEMRRLPRLVLETRAGTPVAVVIWRQGQEKRLVLRVGRFETATEKLAKTGKKAPSGEEKPVRALGLTLSALTPELGRKYAFDKDENGVVVLSVEKGSEAAKKGVRAGDLVVEAERETVATPDAIEKRIAAAKKSGKKALLLLL